MYPTGKEYQDPSFGQLRVYLTSFLVRFGDVIGFSFLVEVNSDGKLPTINLRGSKYALVIAFRTSRMIL